MLLNNNLEQPFLLARYPVFTHKQKQKLKKIGKQTFLFPWGSYDIWSIAASF